MMQSRNVEINQGNNFSYIQKYMEREKNVKNYI